MKKTLTAFAVLSLAVSSVFAQQVSINNGNVSIQDGTNNVQVNNGNVNIQTQSSFKLEGKITANYKVTLRWPAYKVRDGEDLLGYKLVISYTDKEVSGEGDKVVSIDASKTTTDDWNAKNGSMNYYKLYAVTSNGEIGSNVVVIPMDGNGNYDFSMTGKNKDQKSSMNNQQQSNGAQGQRQEMIGEDRQEMRGDNRQEMRNDDRQEMKGNNGFQQQGKGPKDQQQKPQQPNGQFSQYLLTGLTQDQLKTIKDGYKNLMDNTKKLVESTIASGSYDSGSLVNSVLDLHKAYYESVLVYVDESKKEEFNKYVERTIEMVKQNVIGRLSHNNTNMKPQMGNPVEGNKGTNVNNQKQNQAQSKDNKQPQKKNALSAKLVKQVEDKLDSIPDASKEKVYNTLKTKINELIKKLDTSNPKDMVKVQIYKEVLMIVERKISELDDGNIINEIFGSESNS